MAKDDRKNTVRRERLNKEWPFIVHVYPCWPIEEIPRELWDTAHEMRRLWNDFVFLFRDASAADLKDETGKPLLPKDERAKVWARINLPNLREVGKRRKDALDQACREFVVNHFLKAVNNWRKNPAENGPPRVQKADEMERVHIPLNYSAGKSAEWLNSGAGTAGVRYTLDLKKNAPRDTNGAPILKKEELEAYLNNGHFCVGKSRMRLKLHIAYGGRSGVRKYFLPAGCRIKTITLCGRRDSAYGWSWSFQVTLERPPKPARHLTGRVCGWDSVGWRLMNGYIRLGVIADNAGYFYEVRVPIEIGALSGRLRRERNHCEKRDWEFSKPVSWDDLEGMKSRYGKALEACKSKVRKIYEEEKDAWPPEARRRIGGITKMRDTGLRRLRRKIEETESAAKKTIDDWGDAAAQLNKMIRSFEIHAARAKEDAFRQITSWLDAFDRIGWKADLSLKRMAEEAGRKKGLRKKKPEETGQWDQRTPEEMVLENSQKFRQIVGQYKLRRFIRERHGVTCYCGDHLLQHEDSKGKCSTCNCQSFDSRLTNCEVPSPRTCQECGGEIKPGHNLASVCENGHKRDQDVSESLRLLSNIKGCTRITAPPLEIPTNLRAYLRLMDATEVRLTSA